MSPLLLRRYRADRLLREQFEQQRERVIASASARLRRVSVVLDRDDLEAAYAQAWQGLYAAVLDGQQIVNPVGWLAVVTHRRAIDEYRARRLADAEPLAVERERARDECDVAAQLDDRAKLRSLLEAMRARLSERERQAAALCYLQGFTRAEAAAQMGVSDSRMRKLMEGTGRGRSRGVAAKVGALVQAISAGEWCEQQGSLMRGFAFGVLDPDGERYLLAIKHSEACPACRAYVLSLRGLAAVLPPTPALLHWALAASAGGTGGAGAAAGASAAASGGSSLGGAGAAGAPAASGLGAGALSASGAAGAGAAGGGWWLAGGLGAKLAVGCLLALGVGAGCVALDSQSHSTPVPKRGHRHEHQPAGASASAPAKQALTRAQLPRNETQSGTGANGATVPTSSAAHLAREFSPESAGAQPTAQSASAARTAPRARAATQSSSRQSTATGSERVATSAATQAQSRQTEHAPATTAAQREFAPG